MLLRFFVFCSCFVFDLFIKWVIISLNVLKNYGILRMIVLFKLFLLKYNKVLILCRKSNIFLIRLLFFVNCLLIFEKNFFEMIFCGFFFLKIYVNNVYIGEMILGFFMYEVIYCFMFFIFLRCELVLGYFSINYWILLV